MHLGLNTRGGTQHLILNSSLLTTQTFRMVEYEDELDLLAIVVTNGEEGEGRAHIQLHDNQSGRLLRTIDLDDIWDEVSSSTRAYRHRGEMWINVWSSLLFQTNKNEVFFDKDTIVHIEQRNVKFFCHVYKLVPRWITAAEDCNDYI